MSARAVPDPRRRGRLQGRRLGWTIAMLWAVVALAALLVTFELTPLAWFASVIAGISAAFVLADRPLPMLAGVFALAFAGVGATLLTAYPVVGSFDVTLSAEPGRPLGHPVTLRLPEARPRPEYRGAADRRGRYGIVGQSLAVPVVAEGWTPNRAVAVWAVLTLESGSPREADDLRRELQAWQEPLQAGIRALDGAGDYAAAAADAERRYGLRSAEPPLFVRWTAAPMDLWVAQLESLMLDAALGTLALALAVGWSRWSGHRGRR